MQVSWKSQKKTGYLWCRGAEKGSSSSLLSSSLKHCLCNAGDIFSHWSLVTLISNASVKVCQFMAQYWTLTQGASPLVYFCLYVTCLIVGMLTLNLIACLTYFGLQYM